MPSISRLAAVALFAKSIKKVWTRNELAGVITENLHDWTVADDAKGATNVAELSANKVIEALIKDTPLKPVTFKFPYRSVTRYVYGDVPTFELIQSVDDQGYFSHYSAMQIHGLTEQIPKSVYFNVEQPATGGGGSLSQQSIDRAFKGKCRVTSNVIEFRNITIHKINGQNTNRLGVIERKIDDGSEIQVTNIERTLIDITVRPIYAGGISEVAQAYRAAASQVSGNRIATYLKSLNYTYPYHQAIGYYMTRAGNYSEAQISKLRSFPIDYDFYLTYQLKNPVLNTEWRLFVPKGF